MGEFAQMYEKYFSLYGFLPLILVLPFDSTLNKANTYLRVYFTKMLEDNYWALLLCNITKYFDLLAHNHFPQCYLVIGVHHIQEFLSFWQKQIMIVPNLSWIALFCTADYS